MELAIDAEDLVKTYGNVTALDHVSIRVEAGEIFGFLGPNGAGKSTFVKILLNLISPSKGTAKIFGLDVKHVSSRKSVGFLPENIYAYKFLTVEEFIKFQAVLCELPKNRIENELKSCLDTVGLSNDINKRMGSLSKGMLQRVGIAQSILGRPKLLLLDEPTSGLDPIGVKELRSLLIELKKNGTTIFLNSHLLSEVERTCDRVAILNKGRIVKSGTKSDLSGKEKHLEVFVEGFTDNMAEKINSISKKPIERNGNFLKIFPETETDSVTIHKIIIDHGGRLLSLSWKGESLEELFYRLVKTKEKDENLGTH